MLGAGVWNLVVSIGCLTLFGLVLMTRYAKEHEEDETSAGRERNGLREPEVPAWLADWFLGCAFSRHSHVQMRNLSGRTFDRLDHALGLLGIWNNVVACAASFGYGAVGRKTDLALGGSYLPSCP